MSRIMIESVRATFMVVHYRCLRSQILCLLIISHHHYLLRASAASDKIIAEFNKVAELSFRIRSKDETSKIYYF